MSRFPCALVVILAFALPGLTQEKQDSPEALKARVEKLEKELAALKQQVDALTKGPAKDVKPTPEEEKVKQVGKEFVEDLEKDRVASAYRSTSTPFQKRTERKAFDELVEKYPQVRELAQVEGWRQEKTKKLPNKKGYEYYFTTYMVSAPTKTFNVTLTIVDEGGEWKVDDLEIRVAK
jgi:hypothetical protein